MSVTIQQVSNLFERYMWKYEVVNEREIKSGFKGSDTNFILEAIIYDNILSFYVRGFLPTVPDDKQLDIFRRLLQINAEISLVKFALIENDIALQADMPAVDKLDFNLFSSVIYNLGYFADDSYRALYKRITGNDISEK